MTEEQVTLALLNFLEAGNWTILAWDFPQSGTGRAFRVSTQGNKNANTFIPDLLARKGALVVWLENKARLDRRDLKKCAKLAADPQFLRKVRHDCGLENGPLLFGIGLPLQEFQKITSQDMAAHKLSFALGVGPLPEQSVEVVFSKPGIFSLSS